MKLFGLGKKQSKLKSKWGQLQLDVRRRWGLLTDEDLQQIEGDRVMLTGRVSERYGISAEEADRQVSDWEANHGLA